MLLSVNSYPQLRDCMTYNVWYNVSMYTKITFRARIDQRSKIKKECKRLSKKDKMTQDRWLREAIDEKLNKNHDK